MRTQIIVTTIIASLIGIGAARAQEFRELQTIRLPVAWNDSSPSELAVFVNAMARHLQNEADADNRCTPVQFANAVQDRWLLFSSIPQDTWRSYEP